MEANQISQTTTFFAQIGVPAVLIGFAVYASFVALWSITATLVSLTGSHFGFYALWSSLNAHANDATPVIGNLTTGHFFTVGRELIAYMAIAWLKIPDYSPIAHDQIAHAFRWIIGGVA